MKYKANLKSSETYCLLASGANSFDITVSNSNGNTNQFSYSNTTNNSDVVVNAGESITLSLQKALLLKYTVNTISDDNEVSFKFTYSSLNATSFAPILVYNESSSSYFATNTTVISSSPSYAVLKYAMHDDYSESFTANHSVEANTYVVFSKWDSSINGVAQVGETKLDILGDTNIVAVWFEKPGVLRLTSDENSHGKGRFFAYSMGECDYVLTASGEEVTRYSSSNEKYRVCFVYAFLAGKVNIHTEGHATYQCHSVDYKYMNEGELDKAFACTYIHSSSGTRKKKYSTAKFFATTSIDKYQAKRINATTAYPMNKEIVAPKGVSIAVKVIIAIIVILLIAGFICLIYFFIIRPRNKNNHFSDSDSSQKRDRNIQ